MANDTVDYFDPTLLENFAESFDPTEVGETDDFFNSFITPVGNYTNPYREISGMKKDEQTGVVSLTLKLTGALHAEGGNVYGEGEYPFLSFISTKRFKLGDKPGETSGVARYLDACGIDTKGMPVAEMLRLVPETLNIPVSVFVTWADKGKKNEATGKWENKGLKLKDFNQGTKKEPKYVPTVTIDGVTYEAQAKISGFSRIRG